ncbi:NACHT domain-containing protein [Thermomonospora amylolytica]|uniref:NACHT domain-containing protein n=1 Tax=Thermomonospora amylolytica TaxID=1411117 RepID=UPI0013007D2E|nr:ATP-binding protein [Thermomonospora amylolytica]
MLQLGWPIRRRALAFHRAWLIDSGVRTVRGWWRPHLWPQTIGYTILATFYVLWIARAVVAIFRYNDYRDKKTGEPLGLSWPWDFNPDAAEGAKFSYGVVNSVLLTVASAALATLIWLYWRFSRVRGFYRRKVREDTPKLVGAGTILSGVVGRDQLCNALMRNLREPRDRRPHIIVGEIGSGKTALLVQLARMLLDKGAIPVAVQLHSITGKDQLNFTTLARNRFCAVVSDKVLSDGEGEKVWRRLRNRHDKVVVLADGLEELLPNDGDRNNIISEAIAQAEEDGLPLVLTSRPHGALEATQSVAALTYLDPLSEEAALGYLLEKAGWRTDPRRLDWVVEGANVAESPLYLDIAKDLETVDRLERQVTSTDELSDPRDWDEWTLRSDLLDEWVLALIDGDLHPELPLDRETRSAVVDHLSALACVGLLNDQAKVSLDALEPPPDCQNSASTRESTEGPERRCAATPPSRTSVGRRPYPQVYEILEERRDAWRLESSSSQDALHIDARLAAGWGERMGLVGDGGDAVRFPHTIVQAFLASRFFGDLIQKEWSSKTNPAILHRQLDRLNEQLTSDGLLQKALENPGRELITAFILFSRHHETVCTCIADATARRSRLCPTRAARYLLYRGARRAVNPPVDKEWMRAPGTGTLDEEAQNQRVKGLQMYSAALDVDSFDDQPRHCHIVADICENWDRLVARDRRRLDEAKVRLIERIGATAKLIEANGMLSAEQLQSKVAYDKLLEIGHLERSYAVLFTIAEVIGSGGDIAYQKLADKLDPPDDQPKNSDAGDEEPDKELPPALVLAGRDSRRAMKRERIRRRTERDKRIGHTAELAKRTRREVRKKQGAWSADILRAWIMPMLCGSCTPGAYQAAPGRKVEKWVTAVRDRKIDPGLQVALAQGFKKAANCRRHLDRDRQTAEFLNEQAWEMIRHTHYWFVRVTLLHALTLWALPDDVDEPVPAWGPGGYPGEEIVGWLERIIEHADKDVEHPMVMAAADLCRKALQTRRPDRFIWIDEIGVASRIGSGAPIPREPRLHNLWIPPSSGWAALDPQAQQLLADVMILVALATDRDDDPDDIKQRLRNVDRHQKPYLPPCLQWERTPLSPQRTAAVVHKSKPGSNCTEECLFRLCPLPPKSPERHFELSDLFCYNQRGLLNTVNLRFWCYLRFRRRARWQKTNVAELRRFWQAMADRARNRPAD